MEDQRTDSQGFRGQVISRGNVATAVRTLLQSIGEEWPREGIRNTPERYARFMEEFLNPPQVEFTTFQGDGYDEMIVQEGIQFYSLCEHHILPFFGEAIVAYIPKGRVVGLSKLARTVEYYSRGLQNQERITEQVARRVQRELEPLGVGVVLRARHLCMELRGVKKPGTETTTSAMYGAFREKPEARQELLDLIR